MTVAAATRLSRAEMVARLDVLEQAALDADAAWESDLGDKALQAAYKAARAEFKSFEGEYLDRFPSVREDCHRCGGAGGWQGWPGFTCYECGGHCKMDYVTRRRHLPTMPSTREKNRVKAEAKLAEERATFEAALAELEPEVARALVEAYDTVEGYERRQYGDAEYVSDTGEAPSRETYFRAQLAAKMAKWGSLSSAQVDAVKRGLERDARDAARPVLTVGRREVEGEVLSVKSQQSHYGTQTKMLVLLTDGNRVYGTYPRALDGEYGPEGVVRAGVRVGDVVRFTATVEPSGDDDHFGFYSKPAKAEIVAQKIEAHMKGDR